jgi:hypothetical protein
MDVFESRIEAENVIDIARDHTDRIVLRSVPFITNKTLLGKDKQMVGVPSDPLSFISKEEV